MVTTVVVQNVQILIRFTSKIALRQVYCLRSSNSVQYFSQYKMSERTQVYCLRSSNYLQYFSQCKMSERTSIVLVFLTIWRGSGSLNIPKLYNSYRDDYKFSDYEVLESRRRYNDTWERALTIPWLASFLTPKS